MTIPGIIQAYINGWNNHDATAVLDTFGEGGTYEDPTTGGPVSGEAFRASMTGFWSAFPDVSFELGTIHGTDEAVSFEWTMRGTNTGSMNGLPPTGKSVILHGSDFITLRNGRIRIVKGYFDSAGVPRQLGLDVIVQPREIGPFRFGVSASVQTGKMQAPGAFSITHLEAIDDAAVEKVREGSRLAMVDMLKMDGFIGATTAVVGHRMVTVSAWDDADAPRKVMTEGAHAEVMKGMLDGTLARGGFTSVYSRTRVNPYILRCEACGAIHREPAKEASCACGAKLPERLPYW